MYTQTRKYEMSTEHYTTINVKIHGGVLKINWENILGFRDINYKMPHSHHIYTIQYNILDSDGET